MRSEIEVRKNSDAIVQRRKKLRMDIGQEDPPRFLNASSLIANPNLRTVSNEEYLVGMHGSGGKDRLKETDKYHTKTKTKAKTKTKRTFENSSILHGEISSGNQPATSRSSNACDKTSLRNIHCNYGSYRHISQASKRRDKGNKKARKESVIGSLAAILGPDDGSDNCNIPLESESESDVNTSLKTNVSEADDTVFVVPVQSRKWQTPMILSPVSKARKAQNKKRQKDTIIGSMITVLGPEDGSFIRPDNCINTVARTDTTMNISPHQENFSIAEKRTTINRGSVVNSARPTSRKEERRISDNEQRTKKSHFNEEKARKLIRAKLQKNQKKYDMLAAALASAKVKPSEQVTPTVPSFTTSPESIRASIATSQSNSVDSDDIAYETTTVGKQPKLRSRARNGRLYSVCKRIPPSIPEHMILILEMRSSYDTSKASFHPRRRIPKRETFNQDRSVRINENPAGFNRWLANHQ